MSPTCQVCGGLGTIKRKIRGQWEDVPCPACHGEGAWPDDPR